MLAGAVLLSWPLVAIGIFARLGPLHGLIWVTLIGYLFLPENYSFNLPGLPSYEKTPAISLSLLLGMWAYGRNDAADREEIGNQALRIAFVGLGIMLLMSPVLTILTNRFPTMNGGSLRPALSPRDLIGMLAQVLYTLIPFFLARRWLISPDRHQMLLIAIVIMGFIYSFLALFEVRMSPQLNRWIYGYFPHEWAQHVRGGFRPIVFLNHGIWLGFFLFTVCIAAFALSRHMKGKTGVIMFLIGLWMVGVLLISRNLGAVILTIIFVPAVLIFTPRFHARIAVMVTLVFLSYPALHQFDLVPLERITSTVSEFAPRRALSLNYRIENERSLLERANEQAIFGWGGWSRSHIFNERGIRTSTTDGLWIIILGEQGWFGYLSLFALLTVPLFYLGNASRRKALPPATTGLAIIAAGNLIYMIPNATLTPVDLLIYGALAGYAQSDLKEEAENPAVDATPEVRRPRYTRFEPGSKTTRPRSVTLRR